MWIRVTLRRRSTGTMIDYCEVIDRKRCCEVGCQVALREKADAIASKLFGTWTVDVRQVAEHEYDRWRRNFEEDNRVRVQV